MSDFFSKLGNIVKLSVVEAFKRKLNSCVKSKALKIREDQSRRNQPEKEEKKIRDSTKY